MTIANQTTSGDIAPVVGITKPVYEKEYPSTEAQLEVWLSSKQSVEANCAYNEISSLIFNGNLDVALIKQALDKVVERNALLRSTLCVKGLLVCVHKSLPYKFEFIDWSQDSSIDLEHVQREVIQREACTAFDMVNGPLLRVVLQKLSDEQWRLTVTAHHAVLDGWSLAIFCRDLGHFYDELNGHSPEPLPPANQYEEYSQSTKAYLESDEGKADEKYWVDMFADSIPILDLPIESRRPKLRTYFGRRYDHQLSASLMENIRKLGAKSGCSLFNTMLAAFNAYVSRLANTDDFCVGIPTAGQASMDCPELIGQCVNTLPLRVKVDTKTELVDFLKETRSNLLNALEHQRYSYGTLLRKLAPQRDPSRPPMLSVSFNIDPTIDTSGLGFTGLDVDVVVEPRSFENFEWFINGVIQKDGSVEMQVQYNADLYSTNSMQFYFEGFEAFLSDIVQNPNRPISQFNVMSVAQRQRVINDWNQTELEYPVDSTLHAEFSRQANETPGAIAVEFDGTKLTYAEVESRSNQIARFLTKQGVEAGDLVGICVERSEQMLVNLYGILKSGAGYVPLDPAYPSDRLQYMCDHSGLKLIVTESELKERVAEFQKPQIEIDSFEAEISAMDSSSVSATSAPSDVCYVIYTSGSTGKPKGVQVPHGTVVNFLVSMKDMPGFTADDSVLAVTTLSFDIAVLELYLPTTSGGRVVILDGLTTMDGTKLAKAIHDHSITLMQATPATWRLLIQSGWDGQDKLKVLCGGEPMPADLVGPLLERCGELWNMYGPTETTVWSAAYQITVADAPILIGKPIGNTQIYILDENLQEVAPGCEGEVFIGGAGVTLGYRNRDDLTDERFIEHRYHNPFVDYVSNRIYKTGDLARYRFDGNIEFLRRNDKQVKVRGFRIELGEIEQNIKSHPAVEQTVVIVREDTPGDARLVAYLVEKPNQSATPMVLREHLRQSVPYYMVPQHFVTLDEMPQTNNGKIDYKQLPQPTEEVANHSEGGEEGLPTTPAQKYLAGVWEEVLDCDDVLLNDTFFDIGGHSLLVMQVIATVNDTTGIKLGPQDFLVCTLEQLAGKLDESYAFKSDTAEPGSVVEPVAKTAAVAKRGKEKTPKTKKTTKAAKTIKAEKAESRPAGLINKLKGFWD